MTVFGRRSGGVRPAPKMYARIQSITDRRFSCAAHQPVAQVTIVAVMLIGPDDLTGVL